MTSLLSREVGVVQAAQYAAVGKSSVAFLLREERLWNTAQGSLNPPVFERIRRRLRPLPDLAITFAEYELAAELFNTCRMGGIEGSSTDCLICACSARLYPPYSYQKQGL